MKKLYLLIIGIFAYSILSAQVGINTSNPLGLFHADPKNNTTVNSSTGVVSNDDDDVIVTQDGRVGIGTTDPLAGTALDIRGKIRIADGTQLNNRVLTAINNLGIAEWSDPAFRVIRGAINDTIYNNNRGLRLASSFETANEINLSTGRISLPPGLWLVMAKYSSANAGVSTYYSWIILFDAALFDSTANAANKRPSFIHYSGIGPENANGGRLATPQLAYLLEVPETIPGGFREIGIAAANANSLSAAPNGTYLTNSQSLGESYFFAILIN